MMKKLCVFLVMSCYLFSWGAMSQEDTTAHENTSSIDKNSVVLDVLSDSSEVQNAAVKNEIVQKNLLGQDLNLPVSSETNNASKTPQVGKHVMANMNAGSMILSLLMVLVLIIICAFVLKRFNFAQQGVSQMKVVTSLSLGTKERVVVIQVGEQQLLLGVTSQQITLIERLAEPLVNQGVNTADLPKNLLSFLATKKI